MYNLSKLKDDLKLDSKQNGSLEKNNLLYIIIM